MKAAERRDRARAIRGVRAGLISRAMAGAVDLAIVTMLLFAILLAIGVVTYMAVGERFRLPEDGTINNAIAFIVLEIVYLSYMWGSQGKSLGDHLLGLRVLEKNGGVLRPRRAFGRAVMVTFVGALCLLWVPFSRRNAALHDLVFQTEVVHDWSNAQPIEVTELRLEPTSESPASVSTGSL